MINKVMLTIGGSDSGGGAGVQADLKTCAALNIFGTCAITAITAQNTQKVGEIQETKRSVLKDQIKLIKEDFKIAGIKTGMLFSKEIIEEVTEEISSLKEKTIVIVDPVMISSSGGVLLKKNAIQTLIDKLFPLANLITPNIPEMSHISGKKLKSDEEIIQECEKLYKKIKTPILVKGGHREKKATDILYTKEKVQKFQAEKIQTTNNHGTGCTLATAITANLIKGETLTQSIKLSKLFVYNAIQNALKLGKGNGPINHFWNKNLK